MLLRFPRHFYVPKRCVQALHVSGENVHGNIKPLTPTLDFHQRLADRMQLEQNLSRRKLATPLNIDDLFTQWEMYKTVESKKNALQMRQKQVSKLLKEAKKAKQTSDNENTIRKYAIEDETIKQDLHNLIEHSTCIKDEFINSFLDIPNDLLDEVPSEMQVISTHGIKRTDQSANHLSYHHVIDFYDEFSYFLKGDAARMDGIFPMNCVDYFRHKGFVHLNNPDFSRTVLVEGAGYTVDDVYEVTHNSDQHHTNVVHLVGNSSMLSFLGFITKLRVYGTLLPLRWVSAGKIYSRIKSSGDGLFNVNQTTNVQVFMAGTQEQMRHRYNETLDLMTQFFNELNVHYRVVRVPANDLSAAVCFATRIEMFSPHFNKYFEVANLSNYSDFISKRLLFSYEKDQKQNICEFAHVVSGSVCNVTKLIAILLETNNGTIPQDFEKRIS